MGTSQERRLCRESNATWTGPLCEAMPTCRGRRADHAQKDRVGTWEIPRSARAIPLLVRIGKGKPKADDERTREVGPSRSSCEAGEQGGAIRCGAGGAKGWDQGECEPAEHGPDAESENRVTGAGAHTSNRKTAICRHSPEVGAVCGKAARTDLCGGRGAISVPTATESGGASSRQLSGVHPTCCRRSRKGSPCRVGPGNFTPSLSDSGREPLDSSGSCHRAKVAAFHRLSGSSRCR